MRGVGIDCAGQLEAHQVLRIAPLQCDENLTGGGVGIQAELRPHPGVPVAILLTTAADRAVGVNPLAYQLQTRFQRRVIGVRLNIPRIPLIRVEPEQGGGRQQFASGPVVEPARHAALRIEADPDHAVIQRVFLHPDR